MWMANFSRTGDLLDSNQVWGMLSTILIQTAFIKIMIFWLILIKPLTTNIK